MYCVCICIVCIKTDISINLSYNYRIACLFDPSFYPNTADILNFKFYILTKFGLVLTFQTLHTLLVYI